MTEYQENLIECQYCSRVWDGNAQCPCMGSGDSDSDSMSSIDFELDDNESILWKRIRAKVNNTCVFSSKHELESKQGLQLVHEAAWDIYKYIINISNNELDVDKGVIQAIQWLRNWDYDLVDEHKKTGDYLENIHKNIIISNVDKQTQTDEEELKKATASDDQLSRCK